MHTKMATDNTGFVQLWFDGQQQTFTNGSPTINYPTLAAGINWDGRTPNVLNVNQYRRASAYPGTVVTYQAAAKIGTTLAAVQDDTNSTPPPLLAPPPPRTIAGAPTTTVTTPPTTTGTLRAVFTAPSTSVTGRAVTLDGSGSTGSPVKYVWTDGKSTLGTGKSLTFTFHHPGTQHVLLRVSNARGKTASVEHDISVSQATNAVTARRDRSLRRHRHHHRHHLRRRNHHRHHLPRRHHRHHRHG